MHSQAELLSAIQKAISKGEKGHLNRLFKQAGKAWYETPEPACKAAEGLIKMGHYGEAIALLEDIEARFPDEIRPRQLHALALARMDNESDLEKAQAILGQLVQGGHNDTETLGIYARTWMDRYRFSNDRLHLEKSRNYYAQAFDGSDDDYYTGINAAAKSVLLGTPENLKKAAEYAARVLGIVGEQPVEGDYWQTATIAEAFLIRQDYEEAGRLYKIAVSFAPNETGSHQSTWSQACRLIAMLAPPNSQKKLIREAFAHLPDCPSA